MFASSGLRYAVTLAVVLAFVGVGAHAGFKLHKVWVVELLELDEDWTGGWANDVNDPGLVGGGFRIGTEDSGFPAYWEKGKPYALNDKIGTPDGFEGANGNVLSMNNKGQIAGSIWLGWDQVAVRWDTGKGTVTNLHPGDDYIASGAWGINAKGDVCGFLIGVTDTGIVRVPYRWSWSGKKDAALTTGDFEQGWTSGINASGTVSGYVFTIASAPPTEFHPCFWDSKGNLTDLFEDVDDALEGYDLVQAFADDVHENGMVVGDAVAIEDGVTLRWAWTWTKADGVKLLDKGDADQAIAWKTNSIFVAGTLGAWGDDLDAVVWRKGVLDVIPDPEDYGQSEASSVNRKGLVAGYSFADDDPGAPIRFPEESVAWVARKKTKK